MSNKLVYNKVLVDSAFRLPQSRSSSDFIIELDENFEVPDGNENAHNRNFNSCYI